MPGAVGDAAAPVRLPALPVLVRLPAERALVDLALEVDMKSSNSNNPTPLITIVN